MIHSEVIDLESIEAAIKSAIDGHILIEAEHKLDSRIQVHRLRVAMNREKKNEGSRPRGTPSPHEVTT